MPKYRVAAPIPIRPDPDESSPPVVTLDPGDVLTVTVTLAAWSKVSLARAGTPLQGWLASANLVESKEATLQLFDEPLGAAQETVTGRVDIVVTVADWSKVKVTKDDGTVAIGWAQGASAPPTTPAGPVAPEAAQLILGANERYRQALLDAETATGVDAAALAAIIDAEAAKNGDVWDARSSNAGTGAAGLTQFLASTWCDMACRKGTRLNGAATRMGAASADGKIVAAQKGALLDLRFDPALSILTAAEYGLANLAILQKDGLVDAGLGDDERAWFIYLAHHEGPGGAEHFIRKDDVIAIDKLAAQVGQDRADKLAAAAGGDVSAAYRAWLRGYIDQKIQPAKFRGAKAAPTRAGTRALEGFGGDALPVSSLATRPDLVVEIQQRLSDLGYLDPPPDGLMGPTSQWALADFCKRNGVALDGGFTRQVAATLLKPTAPLPEIRAGGGWIDRAIAYVGKKGWFVCRHPDCKNVIYLESVELDGALNDGAPNKFNDLRVVFSIGPDGVPVMHDWDGTSEPGMFYTMNPLNPAGAARIAYGQFKSWIVGTHHPGTANAHEALIQVADIDVYRDLAKDFKREGPLFTGLFGINQHWGYDAPKDDVGNTSAGCLVGRTKAGHREFMALLKTDPRYLANRGYKFMTAVMSGKEALGG